MKLLSNLILLTALSSGIAFATSVSFEDETTYTYGYGFSAKATGFKDNALTFFTKIHNNRYQLELEDKGRAKIPVNALIELQNSDSDGHPTVSAFPKGRVSWVYDGGIPDYPLYKFTVSAGGALKPDDGKLYQILLEVDGTKYGPRQTSVKQYWDPVDYPNVPFHKKSHLKIILSLVPENDSGVRDDHSENKVPEKDL